jgi:hypothetical protein
MTEAATSLVVACPICGQAVENPAKTTDRDCYTLTGRLVGSYPVSCCDECAELRPDEPGVAIRAAALLAGATADDAFREALLPSDLDGLLYDDAADATGQRAHRPQKKAWGHISRDMRKNLKAARLRSLQARVAEPLPAIPVPEPPPSGAAACLVCGVHRSLGWTAFPATFEIKGARVDGHVCGACMEHWNGAVGPSWFDAACLAVKPDADIQGLRPWVKTGRTPESERFGWVRDRAAPRWEDLPAWAQLEEVHGLVATLQGDVLRLSDEVARLTERLDGQT